LPAAMRLVERGQSPIQPLDMPAACKCGIGLASTRSWWKLCRITHLRSPNPLLILLPSLFIEVPEVGSQIVCLINQYLQAVHPRVPPSAFPSRTSSFVKLFRRIFQRVFPFSSLMCRAYMILHICLLMAECHGPKSVASMTEYVQEYLYQVAILGAF
jgi:hypothetical protein